MYSVDPDLKKPYDDSIQVLVHESTFVNAVPSNIRHDMQLVIKVGNSGVHDTFAVEKKYVLLSLKALFNILNWVDYTYGANYKQRTFSEDEIPTNKASDAIIPPKDIINFFNYSTPPFRKLKVILNFFFNFRSY